MITAKELRQMLADVPDDTPIILQTDSEGNGYRYVNGIDFSPADNDEANLYDGEYGGECYRKSDIGEDEEELDLQLVAVVY